MGQAKDAADKPRGKCPARACKKSHASPDNNQFNIDLGRHFVFPPSLKCCISNDRKALVHSNVVTYERKNDA